MARKKSFFTSDKIFGLTAMLISLVTLIIFVRQTNIMDKQSRLSALPYLMVESSTNNSEHYMQIALVNHGVGPAIIEDIQLEMEGTKYAKDFYTFFRENVQEMDSIEILNWSSIYRGKAIPAGGKAVMLAVGANRKDFDIFSGLITDYQKRGFNFEITYRSIYNDKWLISSQEEIPQEIEE
ncbi:hypothetical protein FGF1_41130 [Flavobacteriaceae bacterium GF1]